MSVEETETTIRTQELQHAIEGAEPTKWLTESKDKAFDFNNALNADKKTKVVEFEVAEEYYVFLQENSVKQRGSKKNPNNKYHYEGLPKPGLYKNFGILDSNIEEFNNNLIGAKIIEKE